MFGFFKNKRKTALKDIEKRQELQRREIERGICAQLSRGEPSLQRGEYFTTEDLDKLQAELVEYFLSDKSKW